MGGEVEEGSSEEGFFGDGCEEDGEAHVGEEGVGVHDLVGCCPGCFGASVEGGCGDDVECGERYCAEEACGEVLVSLVGVEFAEEEGGEGGAEFACDGVCGGDGEGEDCGAVGEG